MTSDPALEVQVVYARAAGQVVEVLHVPPGTTVGDALKRSELPARFPEIAARGYDVGIFGRRVDPSTVLRQFDRIEIYRPLIADPKQARRMRTRSRKSGR